MSSNVGLYAPKDARLCRLHTLVPQNLSYIGWDNWAEKMMKTHKVIKCGGCGKYKIWLEKYNQSVLQESLE